MSARTDLGVRPLVRRAWHAVGMTRTAEALMLGVGAGLLAAAAAVASAAEPGGGVLWTVAALAGLPMGTAWLIEMRPRAAGVARRIDQRLRLGGGLVAAWEVEHEQRRGALGRLLGRQLRQELTLRRVLREAVPNSTALIAAPLLGVAALVAALDARPEPGDPLAAVAGVLRGVTEALADAREQALERMSTEEPGTDPVTELGDLVREARDLANAAARMGQDQASRGEVARRVRGLAQRLEQVTERQRERPGLSAALERALALTDAARLACEETGPARSDDSSPSPPGGPVAEAGDGLAAAAGGQGAGGGQDALANAGAQGTMSAPPGQERSAGADSADPLPGPEAGVAGGVALGPWWPDRHAGVVRRFVERRRGAASSSEE